MMQLRAPTDGVVNVLPNFRSLGHLRPVARRRSRRATTSWNGAEIAEIPELSEMYVDLSLEEVDRGKLQLGQAVRVRVDAIPDKEFEADPRLDQPHRRPDLQRWLHAGEDLSRRAPL
jgi:HlyD family secretion protein